MNRINRNTFLKKSITLAALGWLSPWSQLIPAPADIIRVEDAGADEELLKRLLLANDQQAAILLKSGISNKVTRRVGYDFATLSASFCSPGSAYYQDQSVAVALENLARQLLQAQASDGTVNLGNL